FYIGFDWLKRHNPEIDWVKGQLKLTRCPEECNYLPPIVDGEDEWTVRGRDEEFKPWEGDRLLVIEMEEEIRIRAHGTMASDLASKAQEGQKKKTFEELVPEAFQMYHDIFDKKEFDALP
ncbi:hypothetical protein K435DRAFT_610312, partial [Dendrothele bispora CBS 962.96]